jgi:hypothetical protein
MKEINMKKFKFKIAFYFFLIFISSNVLSKTLDDEWFIVFDEKTGDYIAAVVADNGDDVLAYRCFKKEQLCSVAIRSKVKCEDGSSYPMLVNSPKGSFMLEGICTISNLKNYDQVLTPYKRISEVMYDGEGILGIAISLKDGDFKAIRFNLVGATKKMSEVWQKVKKSGSSKNADTF